MAFPGVTTENCSSRMAVHAGVFRSCGMTAVPTRKPIFSASPRRVADDPVLAALTADWAASVTAARAAGIWDIATATPVAPPIARKLRRLMGLPPKRNWPFFRF